MEVRVKPLSKGEHSWMIDPKKEGIKYSSHQSVKDLFLNKTVTDGEESIIVTGIQFVPVRIDSPRTGPHYVINLLF